MVNQIYFDVEELSKYIRRGTWALTFTIGDNDMIKWDASLGKVIGETVIIGLGIICM